MGYSENKYANYIKESYDRNYHETEHGFIVWQKFDNMAAIHTLYVKPESRSLHKGSELADHVANWALEQGFNKIVCEIDSRSKTYDEAYRAITGYGFKVKDWIGYYILLEKDL